MIVSRRLTLILAATLALVAACSGTATTPPAVATTPPAAATSTPGAVATTPAAAATTPAAVATSPAAGAGSTVGLGSAAIGPILVGANGLTLYTHAADTATNVTCTGGCATAWPPLLVTGGAAPTAASGVTGTLATFARADGLGTQVTYNGKPLYFWMNDKAPGDTTGQGINGFAVATP